MKSLQLLVALTVVLSLLVYSSVADERDSSIPGVKLIPNEGGSTEPSKNPISLISQWIRRRNGRKSAEERPKDETEVLARDPSEPEISEFELIADPDSIDSASPPVKMPGARPSTSNFGSEQPRQLKALPKGDSDSQAEQKLPKTEVDSVSELEVEKVSEEEATEGPTQTVAKPTSHRALEPSASSTLVNEIESNTEEDGGAKRNALEKGGEDTEDSTMSLLAPDPRHYPFWVKCVLSVLIVLAFVEFAIYTINFLYCLVVAFWASPTAAMKILAVVMILLWLILRSFYVPFLYVLVPFEFLPTMPEILYKISFLSISVMFPVLLVSPLLAGIYSSFKYGLRNAKLDAKLMGDESLWREVVVVMPVYNEEPHALWRAVQSVLFSDYPGTKIKFYVSFDDENISQLYSSLMRKLDCHSTNDDGSFPPILQLTRENVQLTISRFPHAGKRGTQAKTFKLIESEYEKTPTVFKPHVLFIDSDIILHRNAIHNFVCALESNQNMQAMTGLITCLTSRKNTTPSFLAWMQDCEYIHGQLFIRNLESLLGAVTCLPGALTIIRLTALETVAPTYFGNIEMPDTLDYHRFHLGEDRYLTHLLMEDFPSHSLGFCCSATCKTEAPNTMAKYLKQRRRWLLGAFANEVYCVISPELLFKIPQVLLYKLLDFSTRSVSFYLYLFIMLAVIGYRFESWQWLLVFGPLIVVWILVVIYAILLRRMKLVFMYPWLILCYPIICLFVNLYAIYTWKTRTWGGPRTRVSLLTQITRSLSRSLSRRRKSQSSASRSHYPLMTETHPTMRRQSNIGGIKKVSFEGEPPVL